MVTKKKRRVFTDEFKAEIVRLVLDAGHSVPEVCGDHGLGDSSVYLWVKQARIDRGNGPRGAMTTTEETELVRLRRENRELQRERGCFERPTVYFAREKR